MIEILHALQMIREVSGAVSLAWKPAQLWRIVKSADGTCVVQLRVVLVGLVHDRLDQVVILPQHLIRLPALHQVVQPSDQACLGLSWLVLNWLVSACLVLALDKSLCGGWWVVGGSKVSLV